MNEQILMNYLPFLLVFLAGCIYLFLQYRRNGKLTFDDLTKIVEIGVKAAEYAFIKSGAKVDREKYALDTISDLLGAKIDITMLDDIYKIMPAIINDLPKTSSRLDNS